MAEITLYPYNILETATVTVTGTPDTGFPESRLYDRCIDLFWLDTVTEAKIFHADQGASGNLAVDALLVARHNFSGEDLAWEYSANDADWTGAITGWTQTGNTQIVKTLGTEQTKRYWRLTVSSMANPQCSEIYMSKGYAFPVLADPEPNGEKASNVKFSRTIGGAERSTKFGNLRRRKNYTMSLSAANLTSFRTAIGYLDELSKPFYVTDEEGNTWFARFDGDPNERFYNITHTLVSISLVEML